MIPSDKTTFPRKHLIIGGGMLGKALARKLYSLQADVQLVVRSQSVKEVLMEEFPDVRMWDSFTQVDTWECCWLCVPDSAIISVAKEISHAMYVAERTVVHCSGSVMADVLEPCKLAGASVGVLHPYQTFARFSQELFNNIAWGVEAEEQNAEYLFTMVRSLGGTPLLLTNSSEQRALYHASAVLASNVLVGLVQAAAEVGKASGTDIRSALQAIMQTTLNNALTTLHHDEIPLSGPLVRGDITTLERHLTALRAYPDVLQMYCSYHQALATVAMQKGVITEETYRIATTIFGQTGSEQRRGNS
jgi:predicted short-subunit dehydrogenase-like oxidoreductase (DUF2520 family)